jgi:hypothetical protein
LKNQSVASIRLPGTKLAFFEYRYLKLSVVLKKIENDGTP